MKGLIAQLVICLFRSRVGEFDPGTSHTFAEIDHEIVSTTILLPSGDSRRVVVSYKRKYEHKILVNSLVMFVQEKSGARRTDRPMTIAVYWGIKHQTKQKNLL